MSSLIHKLSVEGPETLSDLELRYVAGYLWGLMDSGYVPSSSNVRILHRQARAEQAKRGTTSASENFYLQERTRTLSVAKEQEEPLTPSKSEAKDCGMASNKTVITLVVVMLVVMVASVIAIVAMYYKADKNTKPNSSHLANV